MSISPSRDVESERRAAPAVRADAVRLGRRIFNNLKKATSYIVAVHIPIAGTSLLPLVFGRPLIQLPAHIAFLELIIDPACSVAFEAEPEGPDVMRRPPRNRSESLYSRAQLLRSLVDGLAVLGVVVLVYVVTRGAGYDDDQVRTLTFIALVPGNLALILSGRSRTRGLTATMVTPNRMLWWVVAGTLTGLVGVLAVPFLRNVFKFSMPDGHAIASCVSLGIGPLLVLELFKRHVGSLH